MWWGDVFFFNDTATTEIYTLSLHDALPILEPEQAGAGEQGGPRRCRGPEVRVRGIRPRDRRAGRYLGQEAHRGQEHSHAPDLHPPRLQGAPDRSRPARTE